jgi:uncharacterized protein YbjT (DUF2867 family)
MTVVVTGATGFLGSALVTELVKCQQVVRLLSRHEKKSPAMQAEVVREVIKAGECSCPLANAHYTNILLNFKQLTRVLWKMV